MKRCTIKKLASTVTRCCKDHDKKTQQAMQNPGGARFVKVMTVKHYKRFLGGFVGVLVCGFIAFSFFWPQ